MRSEAQFALVIAAFLYLAWGLGVLVAPQATGALLSNEPFNATMTALFGAALFAFSTLFLIGAHDPSREIVHASAVALTLIATVEGYQIWGNRSMPQSPATVFSFIINLGVAAYLLISLSEAMSHRAPVVAKVRRAPRKTKKRKAAARPVKQRRRQ